jgi:hypothetical protein
MADFGAFKDLTAAIQSIATIVSFGVGGFWVYRKYIQQVEQYPHIESAAGINFIGEQGDYWIVEFAAILENKGKVRHKIANFRFDVNALYKGDRIEGREEFGGQVYFPHKIVDASFLPDRYKFFFIDPGIKARYSYNGRIPKQATMIVLHCWFEYVDQPGHGHVAEKTVTVPNRSPQAAPVNSAASPL